MRLLVILSPTEKWGTKTEYTKLRKFLHKDGYLRIAPEVYMRISMLWECSLRALL